MTANNIIERVAEAIRAALASTPSHRLVMGDKLPYVIKPDELARVVILAMRKPTSHMIEAPVGELIGPDDAARVWQAMIDAALKDTSP
jgi:hypothetical protein